jgi:hypothetical protein
MPSAPIQIHLKNGTILNAKSFDKHANVATSAFVGMEDEIIAVTKTEIAVLVMDSDAAKAYFRN